MKLLAVVALFSILACSYAAVSVPEIISIEGGNGKKIDLEDADTGAGLSTSTELPPIRHRRVTCDVLSAATKFGSPGSIACAAKCFVQERKYGSCVNGVCVCK